MSDIEDRVQKSIKEMNEQFRNAGGFISLNDNSSMIGFENAAFIVTGSEDV